ncbi:MAG: hypothetical protein HQL51_01755 [Magnetococcales bacterium]|nr:hypothetical protein [Magnetococcales bacterium]
MTLRAHPAPEMARQSQGVVLRFILLDKRTLLVHPFDIAVGEQAKAPWGGSIQLKAFAGDLLIREGSALHGPEGHVNPAAWVALTDETGRPLYEGWLFSRDSAQTAWDHPRFDLTFQGPANPKG